MKLVRRIAFVVVLLAAIAWCFIWRNYRAIPLSNTAQQHFDVLIVLGTPAKDDGTPHKEQRARVDEAIREYKAGVAPRLLMTGGAAHNQYVESVVMRDYALRMGVPATAVFTEEKSMNTVQNLYYSRQIMQAHAWQSAEIVTSPHHVERASLIAQHFEFPYRVHTAPWSPRTRYWFRVVAYWEESTRCWQLTHHGFPHSEFLPGT